MNLRRFNAFINIVILIYALMAKNGLNSGFVISFCEKYACFLNSEKNITFKSITLKVQQSLFFLKLSFYDIENYAIPAPDT